MPLLSLPEDCFNEILLYLLGDSRTLYQCLFVNKYCCRLTIPIIWRNPFKFFRSRTSVIGTLLACLNEDEISLLIPCNIKFNNQPPLFKYAKFVRQIDHPNLVNQIITLLDESNDNIRGCRVQKLVNVIYHTIMRQSSNLKKFD